MKPNMALELHLLGEPLLALVAFERALPRVSSYVPLQMLRPRKRLLAMRTCVRSVPSMNEQMPLEVIHVRKPLATHEALREAVYMRVLVAG